MTHLLLITMLAISPPEFALLHQGLELERQGQVVEALATWERAFTELETPSLAIGRAYVRLATRAGVRQAYPTASRIYLWGLTQAEFSPQARDTLAQELAFAKPILPPPVYKRARQALKEDPATAARLLLGVWNEMDPTPGTNVNERVLEHWQRIGYARQAFTENDDTVYGADERAEYYVKYGAPDRTTRRSLTIFMSDVENTCSYFGRCTPSVIWAAITTLDPSPELEVWVYHRPTRDMVENLVLMFGKSSHTGFGLIRQVEELIPARAFTFSDRYDHPTLQGFKLPTGTMTPGMVMQWIYYEKLASFDGYFATISNRIDFEWNRPGSPAIINKYQGPVMVQQVLHTTQQMVRSAPREQSSDARRVPGLPLAVYPYRFLSEQGHPYYQLFIESNPHGLVLAGLPPPLDTAAQIPTQALAQHLGAFELSHGVRILGPDGAQATRDLTEVGMALLQGELTGSSLHTVPALPAGHTLTVFGELHKPGAERLVAPASVFPESLRGMSSQEYELPPALVLPQQGLAMGDVVVGWGMDYERLGKERFPFRVAHEGGIPQGEAIALHLEFYNLPQNEEGRHDVELTCRVSKQGRRLLGGKRKNEVSVTVRFKSEGAWFAEDLELLTRELPPGDYRLELTVNDRLQGHTLETTIPLTME